ncbi:hypothetical protein L1267_22180 [Pseudoalteromonas sp. OFAV1]|uniref:hypothetical protein n=1 Tax=Pseudoalteromonas sp. OFAV1 TaxID=2908892 RepID=UPI001F186A0B|nr:hypothetical protein [Pseudoalteromonas sp. OFAV1]MCF2903081.1 hypothetical protein [Pseudoalteromonas sp. OFAV1]
MKIVLYHGTQEAEVPKIMQKGFKGHHDAQWYQLATDFESALFHCSIAGNEPSPVYVIQFEVEIDNELWEGYPILWPPYKRDSNNSSWYSVCQDIPKEAITALYRVPYELYCSQKSIGFSKNPIDLIAASKNILKRSAAEPTYDSNLGK